MKSKMKKTKGTTRQLEIEVSPEKVDKAFKEVMEDIRKEAKISGFRPGKAPMDIVQKQHGQDAQDEVKKRLIPEAYQHALEENKLDPISYPEIADVVMSPSGALIFTAKVDVCPEVNLQKYKKLKLKREKIKVTEDEVKEAMESMRRMHSEFEDIDSPLKKGDFGVCDVETFIDDKCISKERKDMWIEVDKDASLFGMGEQLEGLKKGEEKEMEVTLPENYPDKKYAGQKAIFKLKINGTKERKIPELNEEFFKKLGKENLEDVKEEIKKQLLERKEANVKISMKNEIINQLISSHSFDLPEAMVKRQFKVLQEKIADELLQKGVEKDSIESHQKEMKKNIEKEAEGKVKLYFILDKIANIEDIKVTDEDINDWLKALSVSYNQPVENVKKYYEEHDLIGGLKEQLREEKTLDFIVQEADMGEAKT